MVNDRGSKKWVSLMLPEHIQALKKLWAEQTYKEKPVLDEQLLSENNFLIHDALDQDRTVIIKHYRCNDFHMAEGKILYIDRVNHTLQLDDTEIKLGNIIEINIL